MPKTTVCECGQPKDYRAQHCKACAWRYSLPKRWGQRNSTERVLERFLIKVDRSGDCWIWMGRQDTDGYGITHAWGNQWRAHRLAYHLYHGEVPDGMHVCHSCDNRACVNPAHLFAGTNQDNTADRNRKGRQAKGERTNHNKLTPDQVRELRQRYEQGEVVHHLARAFGIADSSAWAIVRREHWKHI